MINDVHFNQYSSRYYKIEKRTSYGCNKYVKIMFKPDYQTPI